MQAHNMGVLVSSGSVNLKKMALAFRAEPSKNGY